MGSFWGVPVGKDFCIWVPISIETANMFFFIVALGNLSRNSCFQISKYHPDMQTTFLNIQVLIRPRGTGSLCSLQQYAFRFRGLLHIGLVQVAGNQSLHSRSRTALRSRILLQHLPTYSLKSLKGVIGDYIGDYYRA